MANNEREIKRKRRKARAALVLLRRKISSACGKAMDAAIAAFVGAALILAGMLLTQLASTAGAGEEVGDALPARVEEPV